MTNISIDDFIRFAQMQHDAALETCRLTLRRAADNIRRMQPEQRIPELDLLARSLTDASVFVGEVKELNLS
jgi:hypothetical protein